MFVRVGKIIEYGNERVRSREKSSVFTVVFRHRRHHRSKARKQHLNAFSHQAFQVAFCSVFLIEMFLWWKHFRTIFVMRISKGTDRRKFAPCVEILTLRRMRFHCCRFRQCPDAMSLCAIVDDSHRRAHSLRCQQWFQRQRSRQMLWPWFSRAAFIVKKYTRTHELRGSSYQLELSFKHFKSGSSVRSQLSHLLVSIFC